MPDRDRLPWRGWSHRPSAWVPRHASSRCRNRARSPARTAHVCPVDELWRGRRRHSSQLGMREVCHRWWSRPHRRRSRRCLRRRSNQVTYLGPGNDQPPSAFLVVACSRRCLAGSHLETSHVPVREPPRSDASTRSKNRARQPCKMNLARQSTLLYTPAHCATRSQTDRCVGTSLALSVRETGCRCKEAG
jgi:hypothetical protein